MNRDTLKQKEKTKLTVKERITLGPIDKYRLKGHFPWKFVTHIVLVMLTSF